MRSKMRDACSRSKPSHENASPDEAAAKKRTPPRERAACNEAAATGEKDRVRVRSAWRRCERVKTIWTRSPLKRRVKKIGEIPLFAVIARSIFTTRTSLMNAEQRKPEGTSSRRYRCAMLLITRRVGAAGGAAHHGATTLSAHADVHHAAQRALNLLRSGTVCRCGTRKQAQHTPTETEPRIGERRAAARRPGRGLTISPPAACRIIAMSTRLPSPSPPFDAATRTAELLLPRHAAHHAAAPPRHRSQRPRHECR